MATRPKPTSRRGWRADGLLRDLLRGRGVQSHRNRHRGGAADPLLVLEHVQDLVHRFDLELNEIVHLNRRSDLWDETELFHEDLLDLLSCSALATDVWDEQVEQSILECCIIRRNGVRCSDEEHLRQGEACDLTTREDIEQTVVDFREPAQELIEQDDIAFLEVRPERVVQEL